MKKNEARRFWNWQGDADGRELYLYGTIAPESWYEDDVTPEMFRSELMSGTGPITVWLSSPGGDCVAASQIYTMLIHHAIVEAFNILPEERENLLTLRDQIERALIAPIDAQLSRMEEDDPDRAALLMQRTEYTQKRLQILSLLAWMGRTAPDRMYGDACVDYDEFVARTNRITRIGEITEANHGGLMTSFNDAEVIRYMEKAVVHPDRLEVVFKAGVTVEVALSTPQSK